MKSPSLRMPAEWEAHRSTWLAWPHQKTDWPGKFAPIPWVYGEIVRTLARFETVNLIVANATVKKQAQRVLASLPHQSKNVVFHSIPTNRSWLRDTGPTFVKGPSNKSAAIPWRFNGWAKYPDWKVDDRVPGAIAKRAKVPATVPMHRGKPVVLEGGGIDVNGAGCVLTTEEWLLSDVQVRNPGLTRADYESIFATYLGATKTLWLGKGIAGDDTHGHVDDLARFVNPTTVVCVREDNAESENYHPLEENHERLAGMTDARGRKLTVVSLPMPTPIGFRGQLLPASYANFYIANGVVIVPTFNDAKDRVALGILADLFPDREVVGLYCGDLVLGLGTLHCLSQQEPL
ncbi:MAG: agmatine deiminase family protein [Gemmataceae bacterium]